MIKPAVITLVLACLWSANQITPTESLTLSNWLQSIQNRTGLNQIPVLGQADPRIVNIGPGQLPTPGLVNCTMVRPNLANRALNRLIQKPIRILQLVQRNPLLRYVVSATGQEARLNSTISGLSQQLEQLAPEMICQNGTAAAPDVVDKRADEQQKPAENSVNATFTTALPIDPRNV